MSYRVLTSLLLALTVAFLCAGMISGQAAKTKNEDAKEDEKEEGGEGEKEGEKEEAPLTGKEMHDMMEDVETAWNKLKINARNKMGDKAAAAADNMAELAPKLLRYDGKVLTGDNKDKLAREQQDFKDWVTALIKACEEYSRHAKKGDWDKAAKEKDKINETCGDCHKAYEPPEKEEDK